MLETANKGLFCQLITIPLFKDHKILSQVAGHGSHTIKLLPPLVITDDDCEWIERAFDEVIADSHQVPGASGRSARRWSTTRCASRRELTSSASVRRTRVARIGLTCSKTAGAGRTMLREASCTATNLEQRRAECL